MTVRVLLADDDTLVRAGLAVVLGTAADLTVVAEAADGIEAVDLCLRHTPDVGGEKAGRNSAWTACDGSVSTGPA